MTFKEIIEIEPIVGDIYEEAMLIEDDEYSDFFCATTIWNTYFKPKLKQFVGFDAEKEELRTPEAFMICKTTICNILPFCRDCNCGTIYSP